MKQRFQRVDPDVFDLAWLDDQELEALQRMMLSNRENEICAYWLRSLNEQAAIRTGTSDHPWYRGQRPRLQTVFDQRLDAARLIFGCIENQLKAMGKSTGERFCELLVKCCNEAKAQARVFIL